MHLALLRTIIKDIEDVARTPSTGLGVNQNSVANPVGGHPQIVEGVSSFFLLLLFCQNELKLTVCFIRHMHGALIYAAGSAT